MKSTGTIQAGTGLWQDPNRDATNAAGFTGLPAASRNNVGEFNGIIGNRGNWWSSSETSTTDPRYLFLDYGQSIAYRNVNTKVNGISVRCLRD
jgi:uncharacterized protein (TIGR02145 family)